MTNNLKQKTVRGILWSGAEGFAVRGMQFFLGLILARLLMPSDYGLIGMLAIFLAISQTFIDSGFSSALIQKKDRTDIDFSTVFFFNIAIGLLFYLLLFFSAPLIANFYKSPQLVILTKFIGFNIVISSLSVVQRAKLSIALDFKTQAQASLISVFLGGLLGITLAYKGFGVWALVMQALMRNSLNTILLWKLSKWVPKGGFSKDSFKTLFSFGSKLLAGGLLNTIYNNIYLIIIGKLFSASQLGFYTRAQQFQRLPAENITGTLQRVTFPVLSSLQNDNTKLINAYRKLIKISAFVIFPLMLGLAVMAKPLIRLILTEKWLPAVPLLQLLCIAGMLYPINAINLNVLNVKGRSDLFLKVEIIKKLVISVAIIGTYSLGIKALIIGQIFTSVIAFFINTFYSGQMIGYGSFNQIKDLLPISLITILMASSTWVVMFIVDGDLLKLTVGIIFAVCIYAFFAKIGNFDEIIQIKEIVFKT